MKTNFKKLSKKYFEEGITNLGNWIRINSVFDELTLSKKTPFGKGVDEALRFIGKLGEKDGFEVDYCDGYATEISYGKGPLIGIYAHTDVVPVSGNWKHGPFSGQIDDLAMYGRGTSDDKGPGMSTYMAMKLLKDNHLIDNYRVRLVIGGNEERGSTCLHYYFHGLKKPHSKYGFTPDAQFPLIYGEKGITNYRLSGKISLGPIKKIEAGVVSNSVIDKATAWFEGNSSIENLVKSKGYRYEIGLEDKLTRLTIFGKSAHGSTPEAGVNAGTQLMEVLGQYFKIDILSKLALQYLDPSGKTLGEFYETPLLHATTYNIGLINYLNGFFSMVVNFRYPENVKLDMVLKSIGKKSPIDMEIMMSSLPLLFDPQSKMIQTLLKAYQEETNDLVTPMITIGGGTYAKEAPNTVAFGSNFPGKNDHIHEADEKIDLEDFNTSISIYARAIYDLGHLDETKK